MEEKKYLVSEGTEYYSPWGSLSEKLENYECFDELNDAIDYAKKCVTDGIDVEIFELSTIYKTKTTRILIPCSDE